MMVLRKLAVAMLSVGVMLPGLTHALAVWDLQAKSALGEPFRAEAELTDIGDLSADEIKVGLATPEDFERLGVERPYFLSDLKFEVVVNPAGRSFIRITTSKPVREPYLDFVVRTSWPSGTVLKGMTALLDPPVLGNTQLEPVDQAQASGVTPTPTKEVAPIVKPVEPANVVRSQEPAPVESRPQPVAKPKPEQTAVKPQVVAKPQPKPEPVAAEGGDYQTQRGDTLWVIAEKVRPSSDIGVHQTMIALQKANPEAFSGKNINNLKRGQVLRVPSEAQIREISARQALASVREQNADWRQSRGESSLAAQQLDATAAPAPAPVAPVEPKAEMKLLAPEGGKKAVASAGDGKSKAAVSPDISKKLSQNQAAAGELKQENKSLTAKVGSLDAQIKDNDKKLELQNAKLAELQAKLKEQQAAPAAGASTATTPAAAAATPATDATAPAADAAAEQAAGVAPEIQTTPLPEAEPKKPTKPAVVSAPEPVEESSLLPSWAPIAGGLGALLLGGFFFMKKRREKAEEEAALAELEAMEAEGAVDFGQDAEPATFGLGAGHDGNALHLGDDNDDLGGFVLGSAAPAADAPLFQDSVLADPLDEVEQYLAYERFPQAVGFLNKAIAANPERQDLRLKLLEVYARLDDHKGFAEQEAALEGSADLDVLSRVEELKASLSPLPQVAEKSDFIEFESSRPAQADSLLADDELPSLEELEMDFNASVSLSSPSLQAVELDLPDAEASFASSKLDDDLDFSFQESASAADELADFSPKASTSDALSFSLDEEPAAAPAKDELSFSLDDDFAMEEPKSAELDAGALSLGDDLDLADFDAAPEMAEPEVVSQADDLSFSLDDLEIATPAAAVEVAGIEGDFNLADEARSNTAELKLDDADFGIESGLNDAVAEFDVALNEDSLSFAEPVAPVAQAAAAEADDLGLGVDDEFDFLADTDENATKLDLAKAYIDMGDMEGAKDILQEVLTEGNGNQKEEAKGLLAQVG